MSRMYEFKARADEMAVILEAYGDPLDMEAARLINCLTSENEKQSARIAELEAERDAAKQDVKVATMLSGKCELFCANVPALCSACSDMCHWQWCGTRQEGE